MWFLVLGEWAVILGLLKLYGSDLGAVSLLFLLFFGVEASDWVTDGSTAGALSLIGWNIDHRAVAISLCSKQDFNTVFLF